MPGIEAGRQGSSTSGQEQLFQVLRAYAIFNPEVGYCQGELPL